MRAIHEWKAKNDRIDSRKIAGLLRSGMIPRAYVYPREMRSTRDLMRRRNYLMRRRADPLAHIQNTNAQCNMPEFGRKIAYRAEREGIAERFRDPKVQETSREQARQGQSTLDHRAQARENGLLHLETGEGVRYGHVSQVVTGGNGQAHRLTGVISDEPVQCRREVMLPVAETTLPALGLFPAPKRV